MRQLLASRSNRLGTYNDDAAGAAHTRKASREKIHVDAGEFKVPSLRNLLLTIPYGRDAGLDPIRLHAKDGRVVCQTFEV